MDDVGDDVLVVAPLDAVTVRVRQPPGSGTEVDDLQEAPGSAFAVQDVCLTEVEWGSAVVGAA